MNAVLQRVHSVTPLSMLTEDETETVVILTRAVSEMAHLLTDRTKSTEADDGDTETTGIRTLSLNEHRVPLNIFICYLHQS